MNERRLSSWTRRHLRWLLCLALLLPLAQVAGAVHLLSHTAASKARSQDAADLSQCALCPMAAAVTAGGAATASLVPSPVPSAPVLIATEMTGRAATAPLRAFDSRGPPSLLP